MKHVGFTVAMVAGLLASTAGSAFGQGAWTEEPFPARQGMESSVTQVVSVDGMTWAFGGYRQPGAPPIDSSQAYLRDGASEWQEVPIPEIGAVQDASAISREDAWAVGAPGKSEPGTAVHWDGAEWTEVPPAQGASFSGITAFAPDDVWAVGGERGSTGGGAIQHWDGERWTGVPVPEVAGSWSLSEVHGTAPDDVWAIGSFIPMDAPEQPIALHWDGKAWTQVPVPELESAPNAYLHVDDVVELAPNDVWLAVTTRVYDADRAVPHVLHWDGKQWSVSDTPVSEGTFSDLVPTGGRLWALSGDPDTGEGGSLLRYDGTAWQRADPPPSGFPSVGTELDDGALLAFGSTDSGDGSQPFAATYE